MNEETLGKILREADRQLERVGPIDAGQIRTRAARHQWRRRALQAGLVLLLVGGGITVALSGLWPKARRPQIASTNQREGATPAVAPAEEMSVAQRIALEAQIRLDHRILVAQAQTAEGVDLAEQRGAAARTMLEVAQRRGQIAGNQEAAELYQRTIALFPETPSAGAARVALAQLEQKN